MRHKTPLSQPVDPQPQLPEDQFIKLFNSAYNEFYRSNALSDTTRKLIEAQAVDIKLFDRLTEKKQIQRYISLLDGRIIFHELPDAPYGKSSLKYMTSFGDKSTMRRFKGVEAMTVVSDKVKEVLMPHSESANHTSRIPDQLGSTSCQTVRITYRSLPSSSK